MPLNTLSLRYPKSIFLTAILVAACGRGSEDVNMKYAGVGLNPDEIGPVPISAGGLIEVDWIDYAGGGLPLGLIGLVSYDAQGGPDTQFAPPYAVVNGTAFVFDTDEPAPDTMFGNFGTAPSNEGSCYTNFNPSAFLGSFSDVGDAIRLSSTESDSEVAIGRRPSVFAPKLDGMFVYYSEISPWIVSPQTQKTLVDPDAGIAGFQDGILKAPNFNHGETYEVSFPGGLPNEEASWGSIPVPLATNGADNLVTLPTRPQGVMLSWNGPVYDSDGYVVDDSFEASEPTRTCLQFIGRDIAPTSATDCLEVTQPGAQGADFGGQIYTGPWSSSSGLTIEWVPGDGSVEEVVTFGIRFLGPVDEDDKYKVLSQIEVPASPRAQEEWKYAIREGLVPEGVDVPMGYRDALACDEEGSEAGQYEWVFDPSLKRPDGSYVAGLQGEPSDNLAEVVCRLSDSSGSFTISEKQLEAAMAYAMANDAMGAIFYFNRTTTTDLDAPAVRDRHGQKHDTSPVRVMANAVQLGRFWFDL